MATASKVHRKLVVPAALQEKAGIGPDDELEFKAQKGKITILVKPRREETLMGTLADLQADARSKGLHKMSMKQINAVIAEVREERKQRAKRSG